MVIIPGGVVFANHAVLAIPIARLTFCPLHVVPGRPIRPNPLSLCKRKTVVVQILRLKVIIQSEFRQLIATEFTTYGQAKRGRFCLYIYSAELG